MSSAGMLTMDGTSLWSTSATATGSSCLARGASTPSVWVGPQLGRNGVPNVDGTIDRALCVAGIQLGEVARISRVDSVVGQLHRRGQGGRKRSIDYPIAP